MAIQTDTLVTSALSEREISEAKQVYIGSSEQPITYNDPPPKYIQVLANLISSVKPQNVLEFGCNGGRNLDQIRTRLPESQLIGVDVNPVSVKAGCSLFNLDLRVADEGWLSQQPDNTFDLSFTVSVVDHMPYPENVLRNLLRVTSGYLVLFELAHDKIGKATHNIFIDGDSARLSPTYRYSYIHDYRYECEKKFGAQCIIDAKFPIGPDNLVDLYRIYVFSKNYSLRDLSVIESISLEPLAR